MLRAYMGLGDGGIRKSGSSVGKATPACDSRFRLSRRFEQLLLSKLGVKVRLMRRAAILSKKAKSKPRSGSSGEMSTKKAEVQGAIKRARAQWSGTDKNSCARYNPRMICELWCAGSCYTWGSSNLREIAESCGRCGPEKECHPGSAQYPPGDW